MKDVHPGSPIRLSVATRSALIRARPDRHAEMLPIGAAEVGSCWCNGSAILAGRCGRPRRGRASRRLSPNPPGWRYRAGGAAALVDLASAFALPQVPAERLTEIGVAPPEERAALAPAGHAGLDGRRRSAARRARRAGCARPKPLVVRYRRARSRRADPHRHQEARAHAAVPAIGSPAIGR